MDSTIRAARAALHMWEEPCISGKKGSGAVFSLAAACGAVSARTGILPLGIPEKKFQWSGLLKFFLELQEKGAANLNLVTGAHYVPHIISALEAWPEERE